MTEPSNIRAETLADHAAVHDVVAQAFGQEDEARLVEALRGIEGYDPRLSLVAEVDGAIIGHILFTPCEIVGDGTAVPAQTLAPLAVAPAWQRRGIGTALAFAGLDACRALGHRIVVVLGHAAYYPRFGFAPAGAHGVTVPFGDHEESKMVLALVPGALDGVAGEVRYPAPFLE